MNNGMLPIGTVVILKESQKRASPLNKPSAGTTTMPIRLPDAPPRKSRVRHCQMQTPTSVHSPKVRSQNNRK